MKRNKLSIFIALVAALSMTSCYHEFPNGGGGGGGTGTAKVSFVMVADTPPATLGLVSLKVVPTAITLTPSSGNATTFSLNNGNGYSFDLVRLQSDSAYLGTVPSVPTGSYSSIAVTFSSATLAFFNNTGVALTNLNPVCPANNGCIATFAGPFTATVTAPQTISANGGLGIDISLTDAITVSGSTLSLNLGNTNAASVFTLPRANSNLAAGQLDLIEDYTGVVSLSGSSVTITPSSVVGRPPITATVNSSTVLDEDPTLNLCANPTQGNVSSCVSSNQAASMDAVLNSDGTFTVQEIEPLLGTLQDTVEGTIVSINSGNQTQFTIVTTDIIPSASNSLIGSITIGTPLVVNLSVGPSFYIDSKGLSVEGSFPSSYGLFTQSTDTTNLFLGQTVAVHVTAFTAGNGTTTLDSSTANSVTLRWSRFTATVSVPGTQLFSVNSLPANFNFTQASALGVEIFLGTQGTEGVTNLDGILNGGPPAATPAVGIRALYIEDPALDLDPAFFAAKVRQQP